MEGMVWWSDGLLLTIRKILRVSTSFPCQLPSCPRFFAVLFWEPNRWKTLCYLKFVESLIFVAFTVFTGSAAGDCPPWWEEWNRITSLISSYQLGWLDASPLLLASHSLICLPSLVSCSRPPQPATLNFISPSPSLLWLPIFLWRCALSPLASCTPLPLCQPPLPWGPSFHFGIIGGRVSISLCFAWAPEPEECLQ